MTHKLEAITSSEHTLFGWPCPKSETTVVGSFCFMEANPFRGVMSSTGREYQYSFAWDSKLSLCCGLTSPKEIALQTVLHCNPVWSHNHDCNLQAQPPTILWKDRLGRVCLVLNGLSMLLFECLAPWTKTWNSSLPGFSGNDLQTWGNSLLPWPTCLTCKGLVPSYHFSGWRIGYCRLHSRLETWQSLFQGHTKPRSCWVLTVLSPSVETPVYWSNSTSCNYFLPPWIPSSDLNRHSILRLCPNGLLHCWMAGVSPQRWLHVTNRWNNLLYVVGKTPLDPSNCEGTVQMQDHFQK